ncbi:MAG TPA: PrsW family glutamic-type intramembrane protease [Polyangiaceae bacterium]|nr:PrsW family glutamic-type intramembrane protease [Polyangiaceae bacterium]
MPWLQLCTSALLSVVGLAFAIWIWRRARLRERLRRRHAAGLLIAGAGFALFCTLLERWVFGISGLEWTRGGRGGLLSAGLVVLAFAPLEEGMKLAAVWPSVARGRVPSERSGAVQAVLVAGGFAAVESLAWFLLWGHTGWDESLRTLIALPGHFFFAGAWGYVLGGSQRERWLVPSWIGCALLHGTYDYIVFGRGLGFLVLVIPMLVAMALGLRRLLDESRHSAPPSSSGRLSSHSLFDMSQIGSIRDVVDRKGQPVLVHWIVLGALVTLGVMLCFLALAVYVGHRIGVDFALADEAGVEAALPIGLLGAALLLAFPVSAYLVARASGAHSVLEPAWSTGAAIVIVLALFSVTEPTALVVALGIAPVGFALACVGAWLGLERG